MEGLKATINKFDLFDMQRTPYQIPVGYIVFTSTHKTFLKTECVFNHKASVNKFPRTEIIENMSHDQSRIEPEINNKKMTRNLFLIFWKLSNIVLNNTQ